MKKKINKKVIIALLIAAACLGVYKIIDATSYHFVKTKAEIYLCIKYDAKPSEIELVDYKHSGIYWDDYNIFYLTPKWTDFSFEFKYNERNFIVNREKGRFYDDYQLDEIEKWCTDWLKENVDERIVGMKLNSEDVLRYQNNTNKKSNHIITESESESFLNNYSLNASEYMCVFFYFDESLLNERFTTETDNEIALKLREKLTLSRYMSADYDSSYMMKIVFKYESFLWENMYMTYTDYENKYKDEENAYIS